MIYPCDTQPLSQLSDARTKTLCDVCKCRDCENPVEQKLVSIVGISRKMKVYVTRSSEAIVKQCEGFVT